MKQLIKRFRSWLSPYPYTDGDVTVLGPHCILHADGHMIGYRGGNFGRDVTYTPYPDPPAALDLAGGMLNSAVKGAAAVDAAAGSPYIRNVLAHALVQLARDGWTREPMERTDLFHATADRLDVAYRFHCPPGQRCDTCTRMQAAVTDLRDWAEELA